MRSRGLTPAEAVLLVLLVVALAVLLLPAPGKGRDGSTQRGDCNGAKWLATLRWA